jgi:hypothetical protein
MVFGLLQSYCTALGPIASFPCMYLFNVIFNYFYSVKMARILMQYVFYNFDFFYFEFKDLE